MSDKGLQMTIKRLQEFAEGNDVDAPIDIILNYQECREILESRKDALHDILRLERLSDKYKLLALECAAHLVVSIGAVDNGFATKKLEEVLNE